MNIFDYIEKKSNDVGNYLGRYESQDSREIYSYSIFAIFSQVFTFGTGFIIAFILDCFIPFFITTFSFVLLRIGGGGYHCSCFRNCFITSLLLFFTGTFLAYQTVNYPVLMLFLGIFSGIYIMPICPKPSENSPSRGYKGDIKFRKKYRNVLIGLICLNILFIKFNFNIFATSISCGICITSFLISNIGEFIIKNIWKFFEK